MRALSRGTCASCESSGGRTARAVEPPQMSTRKLLCDGLLGVLLLLVMFGIVSGAPTQTSKAEMQPDMQWRLIGPFRGGRTVAVTGVPNAPNVFYIAAVNGGAWKSDDYGRVWKPIFDTQPTGSVGAIAVAPSDANVVYLGSGEGLQRPDLAIGDGIYKSTDAGTTWQHLGLRDAQQIAKIVVDPRDTRRVYVAALGHPYGPNPQRGVFRSTDGGATFERILYENENTGAVDLAMDPHNSQILYAAMWSARRPPWTTGGPYERPQSGTGLFKSTDGGNTWHPLTEGLPNAAQRLGRIGIGISPSDSKRIYAVVDSQQCGLYRSQNAGAAWQRINSEERICGRGSDFAGVTVDPRDNQIVYVANTSTYRSTDSGRSFMAIKGAPGGDDYHTVWINPQNPQIILLGSDQGATISVNGGTTWSSWYNQPTAQFFHVITDNRFPYWVYGAQQESGSAGTASRGDDGAITFRDWHPVGAEEYGYIAPDPLNPNMIYGGKVQRFDWRTRQTQDVSPVALRSKKFRFNRTAPLIFSHVDRGMLYLGSNVLFETHNGGQSWKIISPDLTRTAPGIPSSFVLFSAAAEGPQTHRGVIYALAPSYRTAKVLWAGTDDGLVWITRNGGHSWHNITPAGLAPWSKLAQIDSSHFDDVTAYAAVNRFRLDDLHPYIYRTHDGGKTWHSIVNGLPDDEPVNVVREDPVRKGLLFAGTEHAVYVSFDDGAQWQSLRLNMPTTSVRDLVVHGADIVVATHGRSFWILDDISPLRQWSERAAQASVHLFRPALAYRMRWNNNTDTPLPPETPAGKNPPDGAIIDYTLNGTAAHVKLDILDAAGKLVRGYSSSDVAPPAETDLPIPSYWIRPFAPLVTSPGMHRFVWDLHAAPPQSFEHGYPISAILANTPREPLGPIVTPGTYTVRLTVDGTVYRAPLQVAMDPRVGISRTALMRQYELTQAIVQAMNRSFSARSNTLAKETATKLTALNAQLGRLLGSVQACDCAPTVQQSAAFRDLKHDLDALPRGTAPR